MKFKWKGLKLNAFVDGEIEAENKDEAMFALKKDGVIVIEIIDSNTKDIKKKKTNNKYSKKTKNWGLGGPRST